MSDPKIDEIYRTLGRLEAGAAQHKETTTTILSKLDMMAADLSKVTGEMPALKSDITDCKEAAKEFRGWKNRLMGVAAGVSAVAGTAASKISDLIN